MGMAGLSDKIIVEAEEYKIGNGSFIASLLKLKDRNYLQ